MKYTYDKSLKPGDVIRGYHKGYHMITRIEPRARGVNPLVHYLSFLDDKCNMYPKRKIRVCDAYWCKRVPRDIIENQHPTVQANLIALFAWADEYKEALA